MIRTSDNRIYKCEAMDTKVLARKAPQLLADSFRKLPLLLRLVVWSTLLPLKAGSLLNGT